MIADRVCFVHDLLMKRLRLVFMLGGPTKAVGSPATTTMLNGSRSMRRNLCLLLLVLASPASAADRAEEVRTTEIAFAKAFADRDAQKFFLYLADDAQFLGTGSSRSALGNVEDHHAWNAAGGHAAGPARQVFPVDNSG